MNNKKTCRNRFKNWYSNKTGAMIRNRHPKLKRLDVFDREFRKAYIDRSGSEM